jgi:CubicO group peptidase (beta-lactamase class C family)
MSPVTFTRRLTPLMLLGMAACALARPEQVYLDRVAAPGELPRQLDATMRQFAQDGFSGTVLVAKGNRVLLYQGYGDANRARHLPNTAETKFPFGALANQFTAVALLQLESEGQLRLDQPAATWVGADAGNATLAELLTRTREGTDQASTIRAATFNSSGTPNVERFRFPGPSYALLQRVLSAATGRPAEAALKERLFVPAGLDRTVVDDGFLNDSLVARGYNDPYGATVVVTGLVGPLADLYHWHQALRLGALLPAADRQRMFTPAENGYGLGWVVGRSAGGTKVIEHASDQPGFQLWYGYFPESDVLVLLAANNDQGFRRPIAERLTALLVDGVDVSAGSVTKADRVGGK